MSVSGHSCPGRASSKSGHVRYAAKSGSIFRASTKQRRRIAGWWRCPRCDSGSETGASNHALRGSLTRSNNVGVSPPVMTSSPPITSPSSSLPRSDSGYGLMSPRPNLPGTGRAPKVRVDAIRRRKMILKVDFLRAGTPYPYASLDDVKMPNCPCLQLFNIEHTAASFLAHCML